MPSPFPGMNPFLEQEDGWNDFHERFIPAAAEEIGKQVQPAYIVKIDQNVYVQELPENDRTFLGRPDLFVAETGLVHAPPTSVATLVAPARAQLLLPTVSEEEAYIEIRDRKDRQLVTAIELLSPSNKIAGSGRDQYLA